MRRLVMRILWIVTSLMVLQDSLEACGRTTPSVARGRVVTTNPQAGLDILFSGEESYNPAGTIPLSEAEWEWDFDYNGTFSADRSVHRSWYATWFYTQPGTYTVMVKYFGKPSAFYSFQVVVSPGSGPVPPATRVVATSIDGYINENVTFDATNSSDIDHFDGGQTPQWQWDCGNDGSIDYTTTVGTLTLNYGHIGTELVAVRYVDNDGQAGDFVLITANIDYRNIVVSPMNSIISQTVKYPLQVLSEDAEEAIDLLPPEKKSEGVVYSDGIGRSIQSVALYASPSQHDIVTFTEYDQYGLQTKAYLAYTATPNGGSYRTNAKTDQSNFYKDGHSEHPVGIAATDYPFAQTIIEKSPMLRPLEQGAVGTEWQPGEHSIVMGCGINIGNDILLFEAGSEQGALSLNAAKWYAAGELYTTTIINEDDKITIVYKDKSGKEILKESILNSVERVQSYYVYDVNGNLRFIIPPQAIKELPANPSAADISTMRTKWVTEYIYDSYNRQIEKYVPEQEVVTTVYDILGRVVLGQDGLSRSNKEWLFTKYDKYSRPIMTGVYNDGVGLTREEMQTYVNTLDIQFETRDASSIGYTTEHFPEALEASIWTITYYDDYDFNCDGNPDVALQQTEADFPATDNDDSNYPNYKVSGFEQFNRLKDVVTKTKVRHNINSAVYNTGSYDFCPLSPNALYYKGDPIKLISGFHTHTGQTVRIGPNVSIPADQIKWLETTLFYDKCGRVIQIQSKNHLDGIDIASIQYEFAGKVLRTKLTHMKGDAQKQIVVKQRFTYDAGGRRVDTYQQNNSDAEQLVSRLEYNELGQVTKKNMHYSGGAFLQTLDYTYNERGWLQQVNNPYNLGSDLFAYRLAYNQTESNLGNTQKWDGTITAMIVADKRYEDPNVVSGMGKVGYKYIYDDLGRLSLASYAKYNGSSWSSSFAYREEIPTNGYDYNGNIKQVIRTNSNETETVIDNLTYTYDLLRGNRLKKVEDAIGGTDAIGFTNGANIDEEYIYDSNGNMKEDKNKGITIEYNYWNLPDYIIWTDGKRIDFKYSGTGEKLRMTVRDAGGNITVTDYIGGFEYNNSTLRHFAMSEGRVNATNSPMSYEYFMKDHLGNVRMTIKSGSSNEDKIVQQDFYYPFGLRISIKMPGLGNKKLYNTKELVDQNGLNWYHYGARWYNPILCRWTTMDPVDEFYSPYVYGPNDPINGVDYDGMFWGELWNFISKGEWISDIDLYIKEQRSKGAIVLEDVVVTAVAYDYENGPVCWKYLNPNGQDFAWVFEDGGNTYKIPWSDPALQDPGLLDPVMWACGGISSLKGGKALASTPEVLAKVPAKGLSRAAHRAAANKAVANSPKILKSLNKKLDTDVLEHMQSGKNLLNPPGTVWHHPVGDPSSLHLIRRADHINPMYQDFLHPDRIGGFGLNYEHK